MRYSWLLFDADGTLFDYNLAESKALARVFQEFSIPYSPKFVTAYQRINNQVWRDMENNLVTPAQLRTIRFEQLFQEFAIHADVSAVSAAYLRHLSEQADLIDGAFSLIQQLSRHYQLALITNGLREVQRPRFHLSGLENHFSAIVISDEVGVAKPNPAYFDIVFKKIGFPDKSSVLVIGDSLTSDIQGGRNYGLDTCWFNPARQPRSPACLPSYEIFSLVDLLKVL